MKKPINKFVIKTALFAIAVALFFELLFLAGFAPVVTNSTLFDAKVLALQRHPVKKVELMAMGSSVALYELKSKIIADSLGIAYYNFASWGLQLTDTHSLLTSFVKKYKPRYVILCSSFGDFAGPQNTSYFNYINTPGFIKDNFPQYFYIKNYSSVHQLIYRRFNTYPLLSDRWGGAVLNAGKKNINNTWSERDTFPTRYTPANYRALGSLAAFLRRQKVKLIFVQAPVKSSYANAPMHRQALQSHFTTCRSIVERRDGVYLNYDDAKLFPDSLFLDQYHLLDAGSVILTKRLVADLKKVIK